MTREQAIHYLQSSGFGDEQTNEVAEALSNPQWIPVTERLPEKNGEYLVTTMVWKSLLSMERAKVVRRRLFVDGAFNDGEVLAWMEIPGVWEGGEEE